MGLPWESPHFLILTLLPPKTYLSCDVACPSTISWQTLTRVLKLTADGSHYLSRWTGILAGSL